MKFDTLDKTMLIVLLIGIVMVVCGGYGFHENYEKLISASIEEDKKEESKHSDIIVRLDKIERMLAGK